MVWGEFALLPRSYAEDEFRLVKVLNVSGKEDGLVRNYTQRGLTRS